MVQVGGVARPVQQRLALSISSRRRAVGEITADVLRLDTMPTTVRSVRSSFIVYGK